MSASLRVARHFAIIIGVLASAVAASAQTADLPRLETHQSYMEEVMRPTKLDVADTMAVFSFVLNGLPDRVKVYPTENYYYFKFTHNGVEFAGNIRLDASDRDKGKVEFAYFEQTPGWLDDSPGVYQTLDASNGVKLEKLERFVYRLTYGAKSVVFELNDLSQVKPPVNALAPKEIFIGPIFDDSGVRFFLIYNSAIKDFLYILDETVTVTDDFVSGPQGDRVLVGKRTGFVFYSDRRRDRKILVGVYDENVQANNYFDGPFDQLPDNFIEGETLRNAILEVDPKLKGKIDRFGGSPDGEVRYTISPYLIYKRVQEFDGVDRCAGRTHSSDVSYYRCFILHHEVQDLVSRPSETQRPSNTRKVGVWGQPSPPQ